MFREPLIYRYRIAGNGLFEPQTTNYLVRCTPVRNKQQRLTNPFLFTNMSTPKST